YTQQQFPITYADKGKERLQTPVVTPKKIQLPTWKKTRVKAPTNPSYHYTLRSAINISSQGENEAVTTYLGCFHRNLCQIQAIQADYFTVPQILNQFIQGLHSSILQCVYPMHPADLQATITNIRDFETAELETNHVQAINLRYIVATIVINKVTSKLAAKVIAIIHDRRSKIETLIADFKLQTTTQIKITINYTTLK
ncbi:hypothetical protein G9A89_000081, partial [Geosiphon pyriformis]